jgi:hypothetical protein
VSLADLGVTPEEEQVYLAVLQTPQIDRPRLGALTGLGPECVAGCLERLLELCMVRAEPEAPSGVVPVSPTLAVDDLVERVQDGLLEQQRRVLRARAVAADLELALHRGQQGNSLGVERRSASGWTRSPSTPGRRCGPSPRPGPRAPRRSRRAGRWT